LDEKAPVVAAVRVPPTVTPACPIIRPVEVVVPPTATLPTTVKFPAITPVLAERIPTVAVPETAAEVDAKASTPVISKPAPSRLPVRVKEVTGTTVVPRGASSGVGATPAVGAVAVNEGGVQLSEVTAKAAEGPATAISSLV
jgi:hypothetical protein